MKIGIDIDEVLADFMHSLIEYHNQAYKTSFTRDDFFSYNLEEICGGTKEETIRKLYNFYETDYFKNIKPVLGSQEIINYLKKGNELFVITSRIGRIVKETQEWIGRYFPETFSGIYFADYLQENSKTKCQICDELGIEILIEDSLIYAFQCVNPKRKVLLLNWPWNQCSALPEGITRVYSWENIIEKI